MPEPLTPETLAEIREMAGYPLQTQIDIAVVLRQRELLLAEVDRLQALTAACSCGSTEVTRLRAHIDDIAAHATPYGDMPAEPGWVGTYLLTAGALHRALGTIGRTAPSCQAEAEVARLAAERDLALALRDDALAGQGAALHALSRVVDERRAAREEAAALRAERDRASRLLDDEGTARVVAAADRLRALETAQNHAIAAELQRMAEQWDHEVARARKRTTAMAAAEGWDDEDERLNGRLEGRLSCAEDARRRAAEVEAVELGSTVHSGLSGGPLPADTPPQGDAWRITVDVPLDAPDPAEVAADLGLTGTWDAPGSDAEPEDATCNRCGNPTREYPHDDGCETCRTGDDEWPAYATPTASTSPARTTRTGRVHWAESFGWEFSTGHVEFGSVESTAGRLGRIAAAHDKHVGEHGLTSGCCNECGLHWPCPTYLWATQDRDPGMACWDPDDDEPAEVPTTTEAGRG